MIDHEKFLKSAIEEARKGLSEGGIPIGFVLVKEGEIIGRGHNQAGTEEIGGTACGNGLPGKLGQAQSRRLSKVRNLFHTFTL